ncbi:MAG: barstar family protein [Acutalibacteraceae bacterium]
MQIKDNKVVERILDFSDCRYLGEVHKIIQEKLELPEWYGKNLDALWDALTGIMYVPANIKIIYKPKKIASMELSDEICKIIEVFKEAVQEYNEFTLSVDM